MRRTRDNDNQTLSTDDGIAYGVYLAADFCAQHEHGIAGLERMFGVDRDKPGIPGRSSSCNVAYRRFTKVVREETEESRAGRRRYRTIEATLLIVSDEDSEYVWNGLKRYSGQKSVDIIAGFDDRSFAIAAYSDEARAAVDQIAEGIRQADITLMMGGGNANPFDRGGLVLARTSLIPASLSKVTLDADLEARRLADAAEATGIKVKLDDPANNKSWLKRRYHALSPNWVNERMLDGRPTAHPVMFFLNPSDQANNNSGWFTVEELEAWLEGKGPIPKAKQTAA